MKYYSILLKIQIYKQEMAVKHTYICMCPVCNIKFIDAVAVDIVYSSLLYRKSWELDPDLRCVEEVGVDVKENYHIAHVFTK